MISFRYHVVSLVAVLFALAAGIVLGAGPLQGVNDSSAQTASAPASQAEALRASQAMIDQRSFGAAFAEGVAPGLIDGVLKKRSVVIVTLPGSAAVDVASVSAMVEEANGEVAGEVALTEELFDPAQRSLVEELTSQLVNELGSAVKVGEVDSAYAQWGQLLARAISTKVVRRNKVDTTAASLLTSLDAAELISAPETLVRSDVVLMVAGDPFGDDDSQQATGSIITDLLDALAAKSDATVLTGPVSSTSPFGLLTLVRESPDTAAVMSTVAAADASTGAVVTVLAAANAFEGIFGAFGADSVDGAVPPELAEPPAPTVTAPPIPRGRGADTQPSVEPPGSENSAAADPSSSASPSSSAGQGAPPEASATPGPTANPEPSQAP